MTRDVSTSIQDVVTDQIQFVSGLLGSGLLLTSMNVFLYGCIKFADVCDRTSKICRLLVNLPMITVSRKLMKGLWERTLDTAKAKKQREEEQKRDEQL